MRLKSAAGWNQTEQDWRRLLELEPEGCFGVDVNGELAATTTAICYGEDLAWIGTVLTLPDYRRRGLARMLMTHALAYLEKRRVRCIKLDATDMGRPLYESLGFRVETGIDRWVRPPGPVEPAQWNARFDPVLDRAAFGADRSRLISKLIDDNALHGRPGANAAYFGPCVARDPDEALMTLRWFIGQHENEPVYWDVLTGNLRAVGIAEQHGFQRIRLLNRMAYGVGRLVCDNTKIFAIAGFEYG
jgi:GNAT superfamily N-acetyltransferase